MTDEEKQEPEPQQTRTATLNENSPILRNVECTEADRGTAPNASGDEQCTQERHALEHEQGEHMNIYDDDARLPLLIDPQQVRFTFRDFLNRVIYCREYWIYYMFMICICSMLLLWTAIRGGHPREIWFIVLETVVNLLMIAEIGCRMYLEQKGYFSNWWNILDLITCILCILSFSLFLTSRPNSTQEEIEGFTDAFLATFRYLVQLFRVIVYVKNHKKRREEFQEQYIDLSSHNSFDLENILPVTNHQRNFILSVSPSIDQYITPSSSLEQLPQRSDEEELTDSVQDYLHNEMREGTATSMATNS